MPTIISQSMLSDYGSLTTKHTSRAAHICTEVSLGIFSNKTCHCQRHRGRLSDVRGAASRGFYNRRDTAQHRCVWLPGLLEFVSADGSHLQPSFWCICCWKTCVNAAVGLRLLLFIRFTKADIEHHFNVKSHLITLFLRIKYRSCGNFWSINRKISAWLERNSATEARRQWSLFRAKVWK